MKRRHFLKAGAGFAAMAALPAIPAADAYLTDPSKWFLSDAYPAVLMRGPWFWWAIHNPATCYWHVRGKHEDSGIQWGLLVPDHHLANRGISIHEYLAEQPGRMEDYVARVQAIGFDKA